MKTFLSRENYRYVHDTTVVSVTYTTVVYTTVVSIVDLYTVVSVTSAIYLTMADVMDTTVVPTHGHDRRV